MSERVLLEASVPRTLDAWVARFAAGEHRGDHVEGWLFEGVAARREAERKLAAAGVQATLRCAYKPLVHFFLEEVDTNGLASVTLRYPVHPQAAPRRFLLEAYPLAGLWPDCQFEFDAGGADLHYEVKLAWRDGRTQQARVFAPNRTHVGTSGATLLSPTGWLRVQVKAGALTEGAERTDYERLFAHLLDTIESHPWPAEEPFFERLDLRVDLPGFEQPLPLAGETISSCEALHEDIYFSLLEIFQRRSGRAMGDRRLQPGQIVPDVRMVNDVPRLRIALRGFELGAAASSSVADDSTALAELGTAPTSERIARELGRVEGHGFEVRSRQGRRVAGVYHPGRAAPVFISGGQHANETSGIVGALRAAQVLQAQPDAHFAVVPLENPDGFELLHELCAQHAGHMHHAARYSALGDDIEFRIQPPLHERAARNEAIVLSHAQLHVNLHGYPSHEWTRPLSGYLPHGFELWTVPKGFFLVLRHHPGWGAQARALLEQVGAAMAAVPGLAAFNARQLALYERHAGGLPFELVHGMACSVAEVERPGAPVTLITEFPDETIHGDAFRFAHTVQMETVLAAVRAWQGISMSSRP